MSWEKVPMSEFLKHRDLRFKPKDEQIIDLRRIEKIDFSGNIITSTKPSNTDMILVKNGDLVISGINVEKGAMAVYQGKEDLTATIHYSSYEFDKAKINEEFLKAFLKSKEFTRAIKEQVPGGIKTEIKAKHLLPLIVQIPSKIEDQKKIVNALQRKNNKIEAVFSQQSHQLDLLIKLRQQILQDAVQGKLVPNDPNDEPANVLLERIKAEKEKLVQEKKIKKEKTLPPIKPEEMPFEIPENWVWCRLNEITTLITDGKHGDCANKENSGYYFLSAKDLQNNKFVYEGARQITYDDFIETHRRTNLEEGDLCVVNTGATIGKTVVANESEITNRTTFQKSVAVIKVLKPFISVNYIEKLVVNQTPNLLKTSRGSAINNLLIGDMKNMKIPLPPITEQHRIVNKIEQLLKLCYELEQTILQNQKYTQDLLQEALKEALQPEQ